MIRVTIEIIPNGTDPAEEIATIKLHNDLSHLDRPIYGNYLAEITCNATMQFASVKNHRRVDGIIPLLAKVCGEWKV